MDKVEFLILRNLLHNEEYVRKVIPFIKSEYFEDFNQKVLFEEILKFVQEYNQPATKEVLCIEVEKRQDINDTSFKEITQMVSYLDDDPSEFNWLVNTTEKWCRDRAIYLALIESISLVDGKDEKGSCVMAHFPPFARPNGGKQHAHRPIARRRNRTGSRHRSQARVGCPEY